MSHSIDFFTQSLDFEKEFAYGDPPFYGGVKKDCVIIHLNPSECNEGRIGM